MNDEALFRAVLNRIGRQGDMHIRLRAETFRRIVRASGGHFEFDVSEYREIDAVALETLICHAVRQSNSFREIVLGALGHE